MAQQFYPISLSSAEMPMLSNQMPRTVIGTTAAEANGAGAKVGVSYMHNVMPTKAGLDALGYKQVVNQASFGFDGIFNVLSTTRNRIYLGTNFNGFLFNLTPGDNEWWHMEGSGGLVIDAQGVTIGTVNGVSYIYFSKDRCSTLEEFDFGGNPRARLLDITLAGINPLVTLGVVATSGYLIAYTEDSIAWSSTIDPTDFVPSAVTGAGGGKVAGIGGDIKFCTSIPNGLLIYCDTNVISATYTGNVTYPFKFREVTNSKGGIKLGSVAYAANGREQFALTTAGIQTVSATTAELVMPEVTDFLAGAEYETYNEVTRELETIYLTEGLENRVSLAYVGSRYVVISYGTGTSINEKSHALVFDLALGKFGKLKIDHVAVFEYVADQRDIAKETIGVMNVDGTVYTVAFSSPGDVVPNGVVMLGKLQYTRTRMMTLLGVEIENTVGVVDPFSCFDKASLSGKATVNVDGTEKFAEENLREYRFRSTAKNHTLVFTGAFDLTTVLVRYTINGRR